MKLFLFGLMVALSALLPLSGCTGRLTVLKNPETGDVEKCEVSAGSEMLTGALVSGYSHGKCVDALKSAGYVEVKK